MPFQVTQRSARDLINDEKVNIPKHQRPYMWSTKQANGFLETIMDGMPTLNLILYEEVVDNKLIRWLEDGQQRLMTIKRFVDGTLDKVRWNGKTFSEFSIEEKDSFKNYLFTITTIESVPYERRIALFQAIQDGTPLTNGQRFHACSHSPLVKLAKNIMTDSRLTDVFGYSPTCDKKNNSLANAIAIASGLAFNDNDAISTSYDIIGMKGYLDPNIDINLEHVDTRIGKLLSVYHRADEICPNTTIVTTNKKTGLQKTVIKLVKPKWNAGIYIGYILYAMNLPERNWENDKEMFAQFIARVRLNNKYMHILTYSTPVARNWNSARWKKGLYNLDNLESIESKIHINDSESNSESDSDEEEYNVSN